MTTESLRKLVPHTPVVDSVTTPWRTLIVTEDTSAGWVAGRPGMTVILRGTLPKFTERRTEEVRHMAVLEAVDAVRRGLTGEGLREIDWVLWHPCRLADQHVGLDENFTCACGFTPVPLRIKPYEPPLPPRRECGHYASCLCGAS